MTVLSRSKKAAARAVPFLLGTSLGLYTGSLPPRARLYGERWD